MADDTGHGVQGATTIQRYTAVVATLALVSAFAAWRAALRAEERADSAVAAAVSAGADDGAAFAVTELTDSLVAAGLVPDPQWAHLAMATGPAVEREVCGLLDFEGLTAAPATTDGAVELARTLGVDAVHEAMAITLDATAAAAHLDASGVRSGLGRIAHGWGDVLGRSPDDEIPIEAVQAVWADLEADAEVVAFGRWYDDACR